MFEIKRYTPETAYEWNKFVGQSKNGTFLFNRNYMDYHSDRFHDYSLMIYREGKLYALLPANVVGDTLYSHGGLTYGGLIMTSKTTTADTCSAFRCMNSFLKTSGIRKIIYKPVPWIYHTIPSEEDLYAIFNVCNASLVTREISSTIANRNRIKWSYNRRYGMNKALKNNIVVERSEELHLFWNVLCDNLRKRYGVHPVHTLDEIRLLKSLFPENICLYIARNGDEVLGGTLLYITPKVVHSQYISANHEGKRLCVIDAIFDIILNKDFADYPYFDFGKSTENNGRYLNESLIFQKEGFGGRGICYDTYEWTL